jgi:hypothetical protein
LLVGKWDEEGETPCVCNGYAAFFLGSLFDPEEWRKYVPLKHRWTSTILHVVISQKIVLFIVTAARTSN